MDDASLRQQYPAVDAAYAYVVPSYQLIVSRLEAADTRLMGLLTLASTLTLGVPVLARSVRPELSMASPLFVMALILFGVGAVAGVIGRVRGSIQLPNPKVFYNESLHKSDWAFKKDAIFFAGDAFESNVNVVQAKGSVAVGVTVLWFLEVLCLVVWMGA